MTSAKAVVAGNEKAKAAITKEGGVPQLVELLTAADDGCKEHAARAVANLAYSSDNMAAIANEGGIASLILLLETGNDACKQQAVRAIAQLAHNRTNQVLLCFDYSIRTSTFESVSIQMYSSSL